MFSKAVSILLLFVCLSTACKSKRFKKKFTPITESSNELTADSLSTTNLDSAFAFIKANEIVFNYFSAKVNAEANIDKQKTTFSANLRIVKDSVIWASISPALGIEVARVLIRPDSVFFINRFSNNYFIGDFKYINEILKVESNFQMIQAMLLANVYFHYPLDKYGYARINNNMLISSLKKRKLRRETDLNLPEILFQELYFDLENGKLQRLYIQDFKPPRKFEANYFKFEMIDEQQIPVRFNIAAAADKSAIIDIEYSKVTINKPVNTPFNIPAGYERMR